MKRRGFSLMEMMIVLLIVAIVAAAAAPMISKKMLRDTDEGSPWLYTGLGGSITYNPDNNTNKTAMIGTTSVPSNAGKARFYIEGTPQIALGTSGSSNVMNVTSKNYGIRISESKSGDVSVNSVGIGYKSEASGLSATALGDHARAREDWAIAVGSYANTSGSNSTAVGVHANANGSYAIALGDSANASGGYSTAVGDYAYAIGHSTTALGKYSSASKTSAIALGVSSNASGSYAIALGSTANASGDNSTALGRHAKARESNSTALSSFAEASGSNSTALGCRSNVSGSYSTALGYNSNATQSYATALGASSVAKHDYSTAIGYRAQTTASNQIVIGGPFNKSIVWNFKDMMQLGSSDSTIYIPGNLVVDKYAVLSRVSGEMLFRAQVGPPDEKSVYGNPEMSRIFMGDDKGGDDNTRTLRKYGWSYKVGNFTITSDRRLKNVGEAFSGGLDKIKQLKVYNYTFKDDEKKTPRVGVIAQDLQKVFPDAVTKGKDGFLRIRWEDIFYALVNAVKELDTKFTALNDRIKQLEAQNKQLEKQNKQLEERLSKLEKKFYN